MRPVVSVNTYLGLFNSGLSFNEVGVSVIIGLLLLILLLLFKPLLAQPLLAACEPF